MSANVDCLHCGQTIGADEIARVIRDTRLETREACAQLLEALASPTRWGTTHANRDLLRDAAGMIRAQKDAP